MYPEKSQLIYRLMDRLKCWYNDSYKTQRVFAIIMTQSETLKCGYYDPEFNMITDHEIQSTFNIKKIYPFYRKQTVFCVEGVHDSLDLKAWADCMNNKTKLASSDKEAFNRFNSKDISEMIKAIKNADIVLYACIIGAVASVVCVLFLAGLISGGALGDLMKVSSEILRLVSPAVKI